MTRKTPLLLGVITTALLAFSLALAQSSLDLQVEMDEARARLNITDEQVEQLTPIFRARVEAQVAILEEYGIDSETKDGGQRSNIENVQGLRQALQKSGAEFEKQLATVLSKTQMKEFRVLEEEAKMRIREAAMAWGVKKIGQQIGLDEEQLADFKPIYLDHVQSQMEILDKHGVEFGGERQSRTRLRTLLALRKDMRVADKATLEKLSDILSKEQLTKFQAIQEEQRKRNRDRVR